MLWVVRALARQQGIPEGRFDSARLSEYSRWIQKAWIEDQRDWHEANGKRLRDVDHRTHIAVTAFFAATLIACVIHLFHLNHFVSSNALYLTAFLPALAGALHAVSIQGELKRLARTSADMRDHLEGVSKEIERELTRAQEEPGSTVERAWVESTARNASLAMLAEVADWRSLHGVYSTPLP